MRLPEIHGIIDRRILANYRVDAEVAAALLPAPFRPKLIHGFAVAGICLIRLKQLRPPFFRSISGLGLRTLPTGLPLSGMKTVNPEKGYLFQGETAVHGSMHCSAAGLWRVFTTTRNSPFKRIAII